MAARFSLLASIALYLASLPFDAFCLPHGCSNWPAWTILLFGWILVGQGPANLTWIANPILAGAWVTILFTNSKWLSVGLGLAALAIGASFMLARTVVSNEGGIAMDIVGYSTGYWLWLASMAAAVIAAFARKPAPAKSDLVPCQNSACVSPILSGPR